MIDRRSAWSDPEVQRLLADFIPVADEVGRLQRGSDAECRFFQGFAERGHYAGRSNPTGTRQGIYALAPSGELLGSWNTRRVPEVRRQLTAALKAFEALPEERRYPKAELEASARFEDRYPVDGLVLTVYTRDLPRSEDTRDPKDWRTQAWNIDHAWFTRSEAQSLAEGALDSAAALRFVRLHARDNVRGQTRPFPRDAVRTAELRAREVAREGASVVLELFGSASASETGDWPIDDNRNDPGPETRSFEGTFYGTAVWNGERFVQFELALAGQRSGATQYNERAEDQGPAPMGVVFRLAPPGERVAPSHWYEYPR